ncbi:hypothetical protein FRC10_008614 [Ceratobasidium sp. 414]|nr:hypothetical protein FRC10_008614 [Ceratobasidium sp. 414]
MSAVVRNPTFEPCEQVFRTPELAFLVFEYLDTGDIIRLLSTSKAVFYSAAASRWKHTTSATPLLRLLPCTEIKTLRCSYRYYPKKWGKNFTFHRPLLDSDFQRFSIYAPCITRLDLYQTPDMPITISGWRTLLDYVNSGHVLLPNLMTLSIKSQDARRGMLPYPWIAAFACPSLRQLYVGRGLGVSQHIGCAILDHITRLCPDLAALELHIVREEMEEQDELLLPRLNMIEQDWVAGFLQSAKLLDNLATNSYLFDVHLHHISRLPTLQRLEIQRYGAQEKIATFLPKGSFPSLRELELGGFNASEIESLWSMSPLVKNLAILDIVRLTYPTSGTDPDGFPIVKTPLHFFTTLFAGCPQLTTLRLDFDRDSNYEVMMDENTLRLISRHPLRELSIQTIFTSFDAEGLTVERVVALFPRLEVFRWPELYTTYEELHHFVRMPRLRHLAVQIELRHIDPAVMGRFPWLHNTPANTELRTLESTFSYFNPGSWFRAST